MAKKMMFIKIILIKQSILIKIGLAHKDTIIKLNND